MNTSSYRHAYTHIPFCAVICHYCDFYTARTKQADFEAFFQALETEAHFTRSSVVAPMDAFYLGGGTPSTSPSHLLERYLDLWRDSFDELTEVTIEANPLDINEKSLISWKNAGINRISLGIQSLNNFVLKKLGRNHSAEQAIASIDQCLGVFPNTSVDLIYAVPGQSNTQPIEDAELLSKMGVPHISAYHLTLHDKHFLRSALPNEQWAYEQITNLAGYLEKSGFEHYEISNFGKPGFQSKNNQNYWSGGPYLALGPSAHGFDGGRTRWVNIADWQQYVESTNKKDFCDRTQETLSNAQRKIEVLFTSLRTKHGLDLKNFSIQFDTDLRATHAPWFQRWDKEGLGQIIGDRFVPSLKGRLLADSLTECLA